MAERISDAEYFELVRLMDTLDDEVRLDLIAQALDEVGPIPTPLDDLSDAQRMAPRVAAGDAMWRRLLDLARATKEGGALHG